MGVTDPEPVARPSEGLESPTPFEGERSIGRGGSNGISDDAISVGDLTEGGRGSGESEAVGEDERQRQQRLENRGEAEEVSELRSRLDRAYDALDEQRNQASYWRGMYRVMVRIIAEQHDDPALAWLDQITHDRFAYLLSERKL